MHRFGSNTAGLAVLVVLSAHTAWGASDFSAPKVPFPDLSRGLIRTTTRGASLDKLSPDLRKLYQQVTHPKRAQLYTPRQLRDCFGISHVDTVTPITVLITVAESSDDATLVDTGAAVLHRSGNLICARVAIGSLRGLANADGVVAVRAVEASKIGPGEVEARRPRFRPHIPTRGGSPDFDFDHSGLTGKGVIVGIVDSGIDWKHEDFRNADGTTRIVALWDMTDDSWSKTKGKVGSEPPIKDKDGSPIGTVYTREQIDAALKGTGTVASTDRLGHGTACAGTAAGNGRATGHGVAAGTYVGVAPEADLAVVKMGDDGASPLGPLGTAFIIGIASHLKEPCVISHSYGHQGSAHDGTDAEEEMMDDAAGAGKPGVILCAAAGNEGRASFHASGRFGLRVDGQADIMGEPVELFVTTKTELDVYFSHDDHWGLAITGLDNFFIDKKGQPDTFYVANDGKNIRAITDTPCKLPENVGAYFDSVQTDSASDGKSDLVALPLPPGRYVVNAFATDKDVKSGRYDLYLPFTDEASFGHGADKEYMVSSPGDAANVITVGAYYYRSSWTNLDGKTTAYNLPIGDICSYSSPGYRRDGLVKPDDLRACLVHDLIACRWVRHRDG